MDREGPFFDTYAVAKLHDILALDRERVMGRSGSEDAGRDPVEAAVVETLAVLIAAGRVRVRPAELSGILRTGKGVTVKPPQLGALLGSLGLQRGRDNVGAWYELPSEAALAALRGDSGAVPTDALVEQV